MKKGIVTTILLSLFFSCAGEKKKVERQFITLSNGIVGNKELTAVGGRLGSASLTGNENLIS